MPDRKIFLAHLHESLGDCTRQSFLQRLRRLFNEPLTIESAAEPEIEIEPEYESEYEYEIESTPEIADDEPAVRAIDINGTDAWRNHVRALKNISEPIGCLARFRNLLRKTTMIVYAQSVRKALESIPGYVDKIFKEPQDITDETGEIVAKQTGKFVRDHVTDLLMACHRGTAHSRGEELTFYEQFEASLERYLESFCVYRKDIKSGANMRNNAKWFDTPFGKATDIPEKIGTIAEIELAPHVIPYRDGDGSRDELIIRGVCVVFAERR